MAQYKNKETGMDKNNMDVHYSMKSYEWATPQALFDKLNAEFGFTLDPCCTKESAKCKKYYTKEDDGLSQDWTNEIVFMNPPYGREISKWIEKAYKESLKGATVVCLIPARTDTKYYHNYIFPFAEIRFLKGRVKFEKEGYYAPAPFPSAIAIFNETKTENVSEETILANKVNRLKDMGYEITKENK